MSKQVDERVVSMQFDNQRFERNVSTTMSTLDKLKQKLHFGGASKGLEEVNNAAKKVDMNGLGAGVEAVTSKFSALQVMGVTALVNLTNQAVNAGKNIVKALTIDPVMTGLSEYETKINAIQVIQANTRGKNTMDDITGALEELNEYADKTIYNFAQMTSNIGKFTAQGFDVKDATNAVKGLANLAAASGANAEDMSRATYQMSQALGSSIKLMDWNSLRNANMATVELKNTLIDLAKVNGIAIDDMIAKHGSFEQTLSEGWLSGQMFTEAMNIYSGVYSDAELAAKGFTEKQIANFKDLAAMAESAATEVKTFTQLWDVLKETAQSGWTQTWELLVGDFDTAKGMLTKLQVYFGGIIDAMSDARNFLLEGALYFDRMWKSITSKLDTAGFGKIKEVAKTVSEVVHDLKYYQDVVSKVWRGDYNNHGDNPDRYDLLEKAGYDHRVIQDLVNKGYMYELTMEDVEASHQKFGITMTKTAESTEEVVTAMNNLSDEALKNAGLTEKEIKLYRELEKESARTGESMEDIAARMSEVNGHTLLVESFKNAWSGVEGIFRAIKNAWVEIFPPMTIFQLYNIIEAVNRFSEKLRMTDKDSGELTETAKNLQRTLKGVFAIIDIITTIVGGTFKIAFNVLKEILSYFNLDILELTAGIGDAIVAFRDWFKNINIIPPVLDVIVPIISSMIKVIGKWIASLKETTAFKTFVSWIRTIGSAFSEWINSLKGSKNLGKDIIDGLVNGLTNGAKVVWDILVEIGTKILTTIKDILGIHSPSTEFFEIGTNIIDGLVNGIKSILGNVWDLLSGIGSKIIEIMGNIDFGALITAGMAAGFFVVGGKLVNAIENFSTPFGAIGDILDGVAEVTEEAAEGIERISKAAALEMKSKAVLNFAYAIGILVAALAVMAWIGPEKLWPAIGALFAVAAIVAGLIFVVNLLAKSVAEISAKNLGQILSFSAMMISISVALGVVAGAFVALGQLNADQFTVAIWSFTAIVLTMLGLIAATKLATDKDVAQSTALLLAMALTLKVLSSLLITLSKLDPLGIVIGMWAMTGIAAILVGMVALTKLANPAGTSKLATSIIGMVVAMGLMVILLKIMSHLDPLQMAKGVFFFMTFMSLIGIMTLITNISGGPQKMSKLTGTLIGMSIAMMVMVGVVKMMSRMELADIAKGTTAVAMFAGIIALLVYSTNAVGDKDLKRVGTTLLMMSASIAILAGIAAILSFMSIESLAKGLTAVGLLAAMTTAMVWATRGASDCYKNLKFMAIAIGVMAAAVITLSFIDPAKLAMSTGAMVALMSAFSLMIYSAGKMKNNKGLIKGLTTMLAVSLILGGLVFALTFIDPAKALPNAIALGILMATFAGSMVLIGKTGRISSTVEKNILPMIAVIGTLATVMLMLSYVDPSNAIPNAVALAGLMLVFSGVLVILGKTGTISKTVGKNLYMLVGIVAILGAVLAGMSLLDTQNAVPNALAISILLGTLTGVYAALTGLSKFSAGVTGALVPLLALSGIMAILAVILWGMSALEVANAMENALALSTLLVAMTGVLAVLTVVGLGGPAALVGVASLVALAVAVGALLAAIAGLVYLFPDLENFLATGIPILELIGTAIGSFFGSIVGSFMEGVADSLPHLGACLSEFMTNALPFITMAQTIDPKILEGVGALAAAIILLSAANLVEGITSFLTMGSSFADLGTQLSEFMINATPFLILSKLIDPAVMDGVKALAETVMILTAANLLDSLTSWFTGGGVSLAKFGEELAAFGPYIKQYADAVTGIDPVTVEASANAAKALSEMAANLPNEGGWMGAIFGENDIEVFGTKLVSFGRAMVNYSLAVEGLKVDAANRSVEVGTAISEMATNLPTSGGLWDMIAGGNDMDAFGTQLVSFGRSLQAYSFLVATANLEAAENSVKPAEKLAEMAAKIPVNGGLWQLLAGGNDMGTWGDQLKKFGTALKSYSMSVAYLDADAIAESVDAAEDIVELQKTLDPSGGVVQWWSGNSDIGSFGEKLIKFGEALAEYSAELTGVNVSKFERATDMCIDLVGMIKGLKGVEFDGMSKLGESLSDIGKEDVQAFIDAFGNSEDKLETAGKKMVNDFLNGVKENASKIKMTFKDSVSNALDGIRELYDRFYNAGGYLVSGIAAGISANQYKAEARARAMASAAAKGAEEELDINSPSKVGYGIGDFFGMGFINALSDYADTAYDTSAEMASSARLGLSDAISKVQRMLDSDIDSQPTIRPVLDLSDVQAGASAIGGMFGINPSVGVLANVRSVNSMMNRRVQNGGNAEVVAAIKDLKDRVNTKSGDTYNLNGLSYTEGDDVGAAFKTIVRAARMERRT